MSFDERSQTLAIHRVRRTADAAGLRKPFRPVALPALAAAVHASRAATRDALGRRPGVRNARLFIHEDDPAA